MNETAPIQVDSVAKLSAFLRWLAIVDFCYPFVMAGIFFFEQWGKTPECFTKAAGKYPCSNWEYAYQGFIWNFLLFTVPIAVFLIFCWLLLWGYQRLFKK